MNLLQHEPDYKTMTAAELKAVADEARGRAEAAAKELQQRSYEADWETRLEAFGMQILELVQAERRKPVTEQKTGLVAPLKSSSVLALWQTDGYKEVIRLLEDKLNVQIQLEQIPGKGQGLWEDEPYVEMTIFLVSGNHPFAAQRKTVVARILADLAAKCD